MRERLFAIGDDYWIEDTEGRKVFLVDGKAMRLRDTFELKDADGRVLVELRQKLMSLRDTMLIERGGEELAKVKRKRLSLLRNHYRVTLVDGTEIDVSGKILDREFAIEYDGELLAQVSRRWLTIRDTYGIDVVESANLLEVAHNMRAFDVWVHEQDLRATLGQPGNLDSPGAHITRDALLSALPKVVAKDAEGAPANSAVVLDVHGPVEFLRTVRVDADGRGSIDGSPSLGPAVTLSMDWETYVRLACGRVRHTARSPTGSRPRATRSWPPRSWTSFAVTP
ncbi:hypothetical protein SMICM304S_02198 [Streptomyces microflavus]